MSEPDLDHPIAGAERRIVEFGDEDETPSEVPTRVLKPWRAFWAGLFGFGYVYVGRIWVAIGVVGLHVGLMFPLAWTRWIVEPAGLWTMVGAGLGIRFVVFVHPIVLAKGRPAVPRKPYNRWWFYVLWILAAAWLSSTITQHRPELWGVEILEMSFDSMAPTLIGEDRVIIDTWRYREHEPLRRDIVLHRSEEGRRNIKRVVAVPGDEVEVRKGRLVLDGEVVEESSIDVSHHDGGIDHGPIRLVEDEYFLLGDNRGKSLDSRYLGPVPREQILGRVEWIWFSWGSFARTTTRIGGGESHGPLAR